MVTSYGVCGTRTLARILLTTTCLALGTAGATPSTATILDEGLLEPTPLILRDGRIAHVSIHLVPFEDGSAELAGATLAGVEELSHAIATDCFLTAQVIGHVEPDEIEGGTTLDAHRLARSRADTVQGLLVNSGLPATAIASVWDWQFLLREPRVTLWLFLLNEGEDCDGAPLRPVVAEAPAQVAAADEPAPPPRPAAEPAETLAAAPVLEPAPAAEVEPPLAEAAAPPPVPVPEAVETVEVPSPPAALAERPATEARPITSDEELTALVVPGAAAPEPSTVTATPSAPRPAAAVAEESTPPPATPPPAVPVESAAVAEDAPQEPGPPSTRPAESAAAAIVVFPVNSSYFGDDGRRNLMSLVQGIDGGSYQVQLTATVGVGDVPGTSPDESVRYNRWLAERRLERVEEWLQGNARGDLRIERAFREGGERQVEVRVTPLG